MNLIIGIYIIAIGNILLGVIGFWFVHDHRAVIYASIFNLLGILAGLVASCLRSQHKRIERLEAQGPRTE